MQQAATDLWQELKDGVAMPQTANLKRLCELLDWVIAQLPENQQLEVAGQAIEQIAEIYALRFNLLMGNWEEADALSEVELPLIDLEVLEAWVRQSMAVDLDALVDQPKSKRNRDTQTLDPTDSVVAVVEPEVMLQMVEQIEAEEQNQMIRQLAGEEDPVRWSAAIACWMEANAPKQAVHLCKLQWSLKMPWVEIWLGLLLSNEFGLEQAGRFYSNEIWVRYETIKDASL
ncbi:MAG: hypothetical protein NW224_05005 [Leptolyngbyaceae cyanobacterium bins.302]|nr:hypothetical protein [Leptolyngbyaceae cyanobacterium bins.302]